MVWSSNVNLSINVTTHYKQFLIKLYSHNLIIDCNSIIYIKVVWRGYVLLIELLLNILFMNHF